MRREQLLYEAPRPLLLVVAVVAARFMAGWPCQGYAQAMKEWPHISRRRRTSPTVALAVLLSSSAALAQAPRLAEVHNLLPPSTSQAVLARRGDIDGDGHRDLVILGHNSNEVWCATGDGGFVRVPGGFVGQALSGFDNDAALFDADGDGDLDCYVVSGSSFNNVTAGRRALWRNDGSGHFVLDPTSMTNLSIHCTSVAAGDIDGDGDVDLLVGIKPTVFYVAGFPFGPPPMWYTSGGQNQLLLNDGAGNFGSTTLPGAGDFTVSVLLIDMDGDGDLDAFFGNTVGPHASSQNIIRRNLGSGSFTTPIGLGGTNHVVQTVPADYDRDGDIDIFLLDGLLGLSLLVNSGVGTFLDMPLPNPTWGQSQLQLLVDDFDGDLLLDYLAGSGPQMTMFRNVAGTFQQSAVLTVPPSLVTLLDFEADDDPDLVALSADNRLWRNDGAGTLTPTNFAAEPTDPRDVAANGDIDGDGNVDVLTGHHSGPALFWRNDGAGRLTSEPNGDFTQQAMDVYDIAVVDLDGDGDQDVLCAAARAVNLFRNVGGTLLAVTSPIVSSVAVRTADLDGDGDLDIYFGGYAQDRVYLNQGNFVFTELASAIPNGLRSSRVVLIDLEDDGDLDALVGQHSTAFPRLPSSVLRNDGSGRFQTVSMPWVPAYWDRDWFAIDVDGDGDGDGDLVMNSVLYRNQGGGTFVADPTSLPSLGPTLIAAGDYDDDGDPDLVHASDPSSNEPPTLWRNDGTGVFTQVPDGVSDFLRFTYPTQGDFDGDGDVDLLFPEYPLRMLRNHHRQLVWRALPSIGHPLVLGAYGRAGEPYALAFALAPAALPIPGRGTLRLDPASLSLLSTDVYDAEGRAEFVAQVPNDPGLVGLTIYWQALSGGVDARLGNLEITELLAH